MLTGDWVFYFERFADSSDQWCACGHGAKFHNGWSSDSSPCRHVECFINGSTCKQFRPPIIDLLVGVTRA